MLGSRHTNFGESRRPSPSRPAGRAGERSGPPRFWRWLCPADSRAGDRGAALTETAAVLILVAAVMVAVYQLELSKMFNDGVRQMVCLVRGPSCGESWMESDRPEEPEEYEWGQGNPNRLDNQNIARNLAEGYGWQDAEWQCLSNLWGAMSHWDHTVTDSNTGAIGITGFVPGVHGTLPSGFRGSAQAQIEWGLGHIRDTHGTPCVAWSYWQGAGSY